MSRTLAVTGISPPPHHNGNLMKLMQRDHPGITFTEELQVIFRAIGGIRSDDFGMVSDSTGAIGFSYIEMQNRGHVRKVMKILNGKDQASNRFYFKKVLRSPALQIPGTSNSMLALTKTGFFDDQ